MLPKIAQTEFPSSALSWQEDNLAVQVSKQSPVAIGITIAHTFHSLGDGVYNDSACNGDASTLGAHAVAVIGWGTDPKLGDYWTIKNSWGTDWGTGGFGRIQRGYNRCRLCNQWAWTSSNLAAHYGLPNPPSNTHGVQIHPDSNAALTTAPPAGTTCTKAGTTLKGKCMDSLSCAELSGVVSKDCAGSSIGIRCCVHR